MLFHLLIYIYTYLSSSILFSCSSDYKVLQVVAQALRMYNDSDKSERVNDIKIWGYRNVIKEKQSLLFVCMMYKKKLYKKIIQKNYEKNYKRNNFFFFSFL